MAHKWVNDTGPQHPAVPFTRRVTGRITRVSNRLSLSSGEGPPPSVRLLEGVLTVSSHFVKDLSVRNIKKTFEIKL